MTNRLLNIVKISF